MSKYHSSTQYVNLSRNHQYFLRFQHFIKMSTLSTNHMCINMSINKSSIVINMPTHHQQVINSFTNFSTLSQHHQQVINITTPSTALLTNQHTHHQQVIKCHVNTSTQLITTKQHINKLSKYQQIINTIPHVKMLAIFFNKPTQ